MAAKLKWALCLAAAPVVAYLAFGPAPPPREPFDGETWEVDSVMLVRTDGATTYLLQPPYRVVRAGRVTLNRPERDATMPVMRVNFTIGGERVTVFARLRE